MASKAFVSLEKHVESEYRKRGFTAAHARHIGEAVAGRQAHRKWARTGRIPAVVKRQRSCVASGLRGTHPGSQAAAREALTKRVKHCAAQERARRRRG